MTEFDTMQRARELNIAFQEEYKLVDNFIRDAYGTEKGVTEYIERMGKANVEGVFYVETWTIDLDKLKRSRWIRNQLAHEVSIEQNVSRQKDVDWIRDFNTRLRSAQDPLTVLNLRLEADRKRKEQERAAARREAIRLEEVKRAAAEREAANRAAAERAALEREAASRSVPERATVSQTQKSAVQSGSEMQPRANAPAQRFAVDTQADHIRGQRDIVERAREPQPVNGARESAARSQRANNKGLAGLLCFLGILIAILVIIILIIK